MALKLKVALANIERSTEVKQGKDNETVIKVRRFKHAAFKDSLDKSIKDLDTWRRTFDPSWYLIMKTTASKIDDELSNNGEVLPHNPITSARALRNALQPINHTHTKIFLPPDGLDSAQIIDIPLSSSKLAQRHGSSKWLILESTVRPEGANPSTFAEDVRNIARKLLHIDPMTFRLFNCTGVIRHFEGNSYQPSSFTFVYRMPEGLSDPHSLRHLLHSTIKEHPLSERFNIAKDMTLAVSYVHNFGFVHKNIRPETIFLLNDKVSRLGTAFLAGFEVFRSADRGTIKKGDKSWSRNLYRHPARQGESPQDVYVMQHDIYSLGVCLLELGMFESFVIYDDHEAAESTAPIFGLSVHDLDTTEPERIKEHLVKMAQENLPKRMGHRYTAVVVTCLTCLDEDNLDFGDESEFQDEDGILVSVRYIEKVW